MKIKISTISFLLVVCELNYSMQPSPKTKFCMVCHQKRVLFYFSTGMKPFMIILCSIYNITISNMFR